MIYLYDRAIAKDIRNSFNVDETGSSPVVTVVDPESSIDIAAQVKEDKITFPIISLRRNDDTPIDTDRYNFTRAHKGVVSVIDPRTNELYYEKAIPIKLSYDLTILTTNTADMDELIREFLFKYTSMYFLTLTLPYEFNRKVRFGITIDTNANISRRSGSSEYIKEGKLHESVIPLKCEGCVLVSYTPAKLTNERYSTDIDIT